MAYNLFITCSSDDYKGLWTRALEGPGVGGATISLRGMLLLGTREITKGEVWAQCLGVAMTVNAAVDRRVFSSMSPP